MLTVKQINEVSFGKAGFSGYKPEDVDNFIDEVVESFKQLETERDNAVKHAQELTVQNSELSAKNAEIQEKLAILAQKVEAYRADEDGIKDVLISAQRLAKESIQEAKNKAEVILQDAKDSAQKIADNAKAEAAAAAKEYMEQTEEKREELEEMKRQVSAFRSSLLEMYKKHLEDINHIPNFRQKEKEDDETENSPKEEPAQVESASTADEQPAPEAAPAKQETVRSEQAVPAEVKAPAPQAEPSQRPEPAPQPHPVRQTAPAVRPERKESAKSSPREKRPSLHDKVDFSTEQYEDEDDFLDDDLSEVGIDLKTYNSIPESLRQEKESHFSHLEFGEDVDLGNKKPRK